MLNQYIKLMIEEDMPTGDVTSNAIFTDESSEARLIAKDTGILCGLKYFKDVMQYVDSSIEIKFYFTDGDLVETGTLIAVINGKTSSILKAERIALNLLQHMSGIATNTHRYVSATTGTNIKILDTRKTIPMYRELQKEAVRTGGGENHRFSLSDQAMIKDNHIKAAGSITRAVDLVRASNPELIIITECETLEQVQQTLKTSTNVIMLDNMDDKQIAEAIEVVNGLKLVEVSGNMNLDRINALKHLPIDRISIGELTHSVKAFDISLKF